MLNKIIPEEDLDNPLLVGVGGTITSLAAIKLELEKYDPNLVHGSLLKIEDIKYR